MKLADWLPSTTPLIQRVIVENAIRSIGTLEDPLGSNRGPEIDKMNLRAGVPLGSYWCASWAGAYLAGRGSRGAGALRELRCVVAVGAEYGAFHATHRRGGMRGALRQRDGRQTLRRHHPNGTSVETGFERNGTAVSPEDSERGGEYQQWRRASSGTGQR
jgi:hypothetical protein